MKIRARSLPGNGPLSPAAYWRLFRFSPLIMLAGMAAGGWLLVRIILVWGDGDPRYGDGSDILIPVLLLALWSGVAVLFLRPPRTVLACRSGPFTQPVLVWPLGRRFRVWAIAVVPVAGLAGGAVPLLIPTALSSRPQVPADLVLALPLAIALTVLVTALIWILLRSVQHGIELTPTHLIARGYFRTRRFPRSSIIAVDIVDLTLWQGFVVSSLMNRVVDYAPQLSFNDGSKVTLLAGTSHGRDMDMGAEIIRAWLAAGPESAAAIGHKT